MMLDFNKLSFTSDSFSFAGTVRAKLSYMSSTWSMVISPDTGDYVIGLLIYVVV